MKSKRIGIYPGFNTSTHDPIHKRVIEWYDAIPYTYHEALREVQLSKLELILLKIVKLYYFLMLLFKRDRTSGLFYKNVNILHSVVELTVVYSKDGRFDRFSKNAFKCLNTAIQVAYNAQRLVKEDRIAIVIGGDEAFVYGSVWGQIAAKYNIRHFHLKQREGFVSAFPLDLKTLFAGPRYYELENNPEAVTNEKLLSEIRTVIEHGNYTYMRKASHDTDKDLSYLEGAFVLYLHDFLDSPGIYGQVFFFDLWEWIDMAIQASLKHKERLVIKIHPNVSEKNQVAIARLKRKVSRFKNVRVTNDHFSLYTFREKVKGVLTIFGTVMAESRQFNIPCLSAAINHPYLCGNLVPKIHSKEDYILKLNQFFKSQKLMDTSQASDPALTYYLANYEPFFKNSLFEGLPYDDMSMELFKKLHPTIENVDSYGIHERRAIFLYSSETKNYIQNYLDENEEALKKRLDYLLNSFN
jgi:hypothetical protein